MHAIKMKRTRPDDDQGIAGAFVSCPFPIPYFFRSFPLSVSCMSSVDCDFISSAAVDPFPDPRVIIAKAFYRRRSSYAIIGSVGILLRLGLYATWRVKENMPKTTRQRIAPNKNRVIRW